MIRFWRRRRLGSEAARSRHPDATLLPEMPPMIPTFSPCNGHRPLRLSPGLSLGLALALGASLSGCLDAPTEPTLEGIAPQASALESRAGGVVRVSVPADDPGPPFYTRVSPYPEILNQVFTDGRTVAIPVYRNPACIPVDFNLFRMYDPPSASGPGAFGCPVLVEGDYLIEANAPFGQIPFHVNVRGPAQIWFVDHDEFLARTTDGILPWGRLVHDFTSLRIGTADHFNEIHRPRRDPEHHLIISSRGSLADGGRFMFNVNHRGSEIQSIMIRLDR